MGSILKRIALALGLALMADRLVRLIWFAGILRNVYTHHPGPCHELPGIVNGSEDIVTASNGLAFISSGVWRMGDPQSGVKGQIFLFDFNHPGDPPEVIQVEGGGIQPDNWIPLGMDIWETGSPDDPQLTLYVINREPGQIGVEVFDFLYSDGVPTLRHKRKIQHSNIWSPNNLVVIDESRFYTTNDGHLPKPFDLLETLLSLPLGNVAYFDGREARIVAGRIKMANGINLSQDKKLLYVSAALEEEIRIYKTSGNGDVDLLKSIPLFTVPDNINVDKEDGSLWIGTHPSIYCTLIPGNGSGQVVNMKLDEELNPTIREVFADTTGMIKGSSIASRHGNGMLIGTIIEKAAYCKIIAY